MSIPKKVRSFTLISVCFVDIVERCLLYRDLVNLGAPSDFKLQQPNTSVIDSGFSQGDLSCFTCGSNFTENVYQMRSERALDLKYFDQAINDLDKAISINPNNPDYFLNRSTAFLNKGDFDRSMRDYEQYLDRKPNTSFKELGQFYMGFAEGLYDGVKTSGKNIGLGAFNAAVHPIDTADEIAQTLNILGKLAYSGEWDTIGQVLAPEIYELVKNGNKLPPDKQGELSGKAFGKLGVDILIPAKLAKLTTKGAKGMKEIAAAYKSLKNAEKVLALEVASEAIQEIDKIIPKTVEESTINIKKLTEAGKIIDRGGFTKAGRGLMKHGYRDESVFPKPLGNPPNVNEHGQKVLEQILNHPEKKISFGKSERYGGEYTDIFAPGIGGVRYTSRGDFVGFLEPRK